MRQSVHEWYINWFLHMTILISATSKTKNFHTTSAIPKHTNTNKTFTSIQSNKTKTIKHKNNPKTNQSINPWTNYPHWRAVPTRLFEEFGVLRLHFTFLNVKIEFNRVQRVFKNLNSNDVELNSVHDVLWFDFVFFFCKLLIYTYYFCEYFHVICFNLSTTYET